MTAVVSSYRTGFCGVGRHTACPAVIRHSGRATPCAYGCNDEAPLPAGGLLLAVSGPTSPVPGMEGKPEPGPAAP